jgi:hypothetical protein
MAGAPRPFIGLMAGIAAGLVAAAALAAIESLAADEDKGDPSGAMVPLVTGAVVGGIYGVLSEYRPEASASFGGTYGVVTATLLDEAATTALAAPDAVPPQAHLHDVASHLVFGIILEGVRRLFAGKR